MIADITHAYYAHPTAWNEIGFGGPASPRGYVRMQLDRRDPWEAAEAKPGGGRRRRGRTACRLTRHRSARRAPRQRRPRARRVRVGGWVPMREYREDEAVDFVVVGTGAGGGPLLAGLAEGGFSVVGFDAGPYFRPLEEFASDETEQNKLYWTDERVVDGANPMVMGGKNSGKAVGGSTVHFAMVSLRFRPEWFKSRTRWATAPTGRSIGARCGTITAGPSAQLSISGPVSYPWGPKRPRYPYRAHELNGAAELLAAVRRRWATAGRRRRSPPCRPRAASRRPACIAASAASAARPTPSRASW